MRLSNSTSISLAYGVISRWCESKKASEDNQHDMKKYTYGTSGVNLLITWFESFGLRAKNLFADLSHVQSLTSPFNTMATD